MELLSALPDRMTGCTLCTSLVIVLSLLASGCAPPAPPGAFSAQSGEPAPADAGLDRSGALEWLPNRSGTWLHWSEVSTCVEIVRSIEQINRSLYLVEVEEAPHGGLQERWRTCEIELTPVIGQQARVPDILRESSAPLPAEGAMIIGNGEALSYLSGPVIELWGVELARPVSEPFVTEVDDPRLIDSDGDGAPAATLLVGSSCELQLAQRRVTAYQGDFVGPDRIEGRALSVTEQLVIDANETLCKTRYRLRSQPAQSQFVRLRVDGAGGALNLDQDQNGEISCAEVGGLMGELFPPRPVDDQSCNADP